MSYTPSGNRYAAMMDYRLIPYRGRSRTRRPGINTVPKDPTQPSARPRMGAAVRRPTSKSRTRTATLSRRRRAIVPQVYPGPGSQSVYKHRKGYPDRLAKHIFKQFIGKNTTSDQSANFSTSTTGRQAVTLINTLFGNADFQQMKNQVLPVVATDPDNDLTVNNTSAKSAKFFVRKAYSVLHLKNQSNIAQKCIILDILCKKDAPSVVTNGAVTTPLSAWVTGTDHDINTVNSANNLIVGTYPTMSDEFNKYYKIVNKVRLHMEPGFFHEHRIKYNVNKLYNSVTIDNQTTTQIKNWTLNTIIIHYGTLANDTVTNSQVTYAPAKIDYAISKSYVYQYMLNNYNTLKQNTTHITTVSNALEHMGDADKSTQAVNSV